MEIYGFIPLLITLVMNYTTGHRVFTKDELKDVYKYFDGSGCPGDARNFVATKKKYFRYLERSHKDPNILYVGAMNNVYKIDMTDMSCLNYNESRPTNDTIRRCYIQGKEKDVECQNHIRVVMEMPDKLLVCGTGGYAPIKYHLTDHLQINETSNGVAYCPFDPWDNYTAILISEGNPGDQVVPYFGTYTDFIKSSPVFYRPKFEGRTNGVSYSEKTTDREEIGWLNSPQFVGSFDDEEKVIFFFRETSVENKINRNKIYSRVGKVCKQDLGGGFNEMATKTKWLSFQKARLICSLPGTSPHYFDDIYDVYQTGDYFYALFYKQK
ncbi:semaphorin-2A-like isoform X2 [Ruditapes philippinarum]|uniref:semaphorin-2A-like isoform X2 n=1 Tax=Ruditapes philippinarum TaxID=129788 RepID=UPI00295B6D67|nr:semaphorin-2A-like isoform X2 [Ruditapes philippinarum]